MAAVNQPEGAPSPRRDAGRKEARPTAARIVLGARLRALRQASGVSREDAAGRIRGSHAKITRLERGQVGFKERDLEDLLTLYGVLDPAEREECYALARQANTPGWWQPYNDVLESWFEPHLGLEEAAALIRTYEVQFLPGLLQTEAYARAVTRLGYGGWPRARIERLVRLRMERQRLLTREDPPRLWVVLDEAVLRRPFGGPDVMREQLEHLLRVMELPQVSLQIAPFSVGANAAAGTPVTILRFDDPQLPDKVYLEQLTGAVYLDKRHEVDQYMLIMDRLCTAANPPEDTGRFLRHLLGQYR